MLLEEKTFCLPSTEHSTGAYRNCSDDVPGLSFRIVPEGK